MATLAYSICAPAAATPHLALPPLPHPAGEELRPWIADPRAVKLLASLCASPPVGMIHRARYGNATDKWFAYVGFRVECLEAIRMQVGEKLMADYHLHGEGAYEPFRQWCEQPNATDAILAAIASSTEH